MATSLQRASGGGIRGKSGARPVFDPLGLKKSKPSTEKTAEELALERNQRSLLDKEIEDSEERFKALARNKLGAQSLLSGAASTAEQAASGSRRGGSGGVGSLLGGGRPTSRGGSRTSSGSSSVSRK